MEMDKDRGCGGRGRKDERDGGRKVNRENERMFMKTRGGESWHLSASCE